MIVLYIIKITSVGSKEKLNVIDPIESIYTSKFRDFVKFPSTFFVHEMTL